MRPTRLLEPKLHIPMNKLYLAPSHISPPRHLTTPHLTSYLYPYFKFSGLFHTHLVPSALRPLAACTLFYHITGGHSEHFYRGLGYQRHRQNLAKYDKHSKHKINILPWCEKYLNPDWGAAAHCFIFMQCLNSLRTTKRENSHHLSVYHFASNYLC